MRVVSSVRAASQMAVAASRYASRADEVRVVIATSGAMLAIFAAMRAGSANQELSRRGPGARIGQPRESEPLAVGGPSGKRFSDSRSSDRAI